MSSMRSVRTGRSLTIISALLLSTAIAAPAFAQIEEVVVTAQKKSEDIQSVPIAVSAFSAQDLAAHQITTFKDLQFSTPSTNYTKTNFTGTNFSIRGIGTQVISGDAEGGVAFDVDDVYYAAAPVDSGQFYDLQDVEILRGPQSTLYGRGATGGAVNVFSAKPELDSFAASVDASYGNYNAMELKGMVNVPLVDGQLGLRVAGDWIKHDGFATNIYNAPGADHHPDSRDQYSIRGLLRWQPTDKTTVDFIVSAAHEDDTRMRGQKQLCGSDPTGVLGCSPDALGANPVNLNGTYFNIPVSQQALGTAFAALYGGSYAVASGLGLFDLTQPFVAPAGAVPSDPRKVNTDFNPVLHGRSASYTMEWKQKWASWLDSTLVLNAANGGTLSQESYTNFPTANFDPVKVATSLGTFQATLASFVGAGLVPASYADPVNGPYAFILNHGGLFPTSSFNNNGIVGGSIERYVPNELAYDQSSGRSNQKELDFRMNTDFNGPVNFMLAAFYLHTAASGDYYVGNDTLDYGQTLFGGLLGPIDANSFCVPNGCIYGSPFYDNRTQSTTLDSRAVYGEAYWDIVPDTLKFTGGLRFTQDVKKSIGRITIFDGFEQIGNTNSDQALNLIADTGQTDFDTGNGTPPYDEFYHVRSSFNKVTGRAVLDWTPKIDWTDATLVYASYSRGYKAGGSNPGVEPGVGNGLPPTYGPETIDAYELGTKNTLLDGTLQANADVWYYDYKGYQISQIIANTSINANIDAKLYGVEGELKWAPDTHWAFDLNVNGMHTAVGNAALVDPRNPGASDPTALVLKDSQLSPTNAQNCVLYHTGVGPLATGNLDTDFATLSAITGGHIFFAPPGGIHGLAAKGVANTAYGSCFAGTDPTNAFYGLSLQNPATLGAALAATGWALSNPADGGTLTGVPTNVKGNRLANTPNFSFSIGAQYTFDMDGGYTLVPRADYYYQGDMWGRIFTDGADKIKGWGVANAQLTLNAPDNAWYVQAFIKNIADSNNVTGEYLTSSSSGLWTGMFYGDPRMYGVQAGIHF